MPACVTCDCGATVSTARLPANCAMYKTRRGALWASYGIIFISAMRTLRLCAICRGPESIQAAYVKYEQLELITNDRFTGTDAGKVCDVNDSRRRFLSTVWTYFMAGTGILCPTLEYKSTDASNVYDVQA